MPFWSYILLCLKNVLYNKNQGNENFTHFTCGVSKSILKFILIGCEKILLLLYGEEFVAINFNYRKKVVISEKFLFFIYFIIIVNWVFYTCSIPTLKLDSKATLHIFSPFFNFLSRQSKLLRFYCLVLNFIFIYTLIYIWYIVYCLLIPYTYLLKRKEKQFIQQFQKHVLIHTNYTLTKS